MTRVSPCRKHKFYREFLTEEETYGTRLVAADRFHATDKRTNEHRVNPPRRRGLIKYISISYTSIHVQARPDI